MLRIKTCDENTFQLEGQPATLRAHIKPIENQVNEDNTQVGFPLLNYCNYPVGGFDNEIFEMTRMNHILKT